MLEVPSKKSIGMIRRKAVDLSHFNPVTESQLSDSETLPLIFQPAAVEVDLAEWVRTNRDMVRAKMHKHGGVLFRGFGLTGSDDFEKVASALSGSLYGEYGDLVRESITDKIYTSTWYPEDKSILYHNESSHMNSWPGVISFLSLVVAREGGATPIVDCRKVYQGLDPEVREAFEQKGVVYVRNFTEGLDVSWQRFFGTEDKAVVEASCRQAGTTWEWLSDQHLRISQRCRAVLRHPVTGEKSFFNQVQLHHLNCLDAETRDSILSMFHLDQSPRHVYYGDGSSIENAVMDHVGEIYERYAVRFQWQAGDMVSLDNMLVAHARDPYKGPRKILVAMGDMTYGDQIN